MRALQLLAVISVIVAASLPRGGSAVRQTPPPYCDSRLRSSADDAYGYRVRGDRCEGLYARDVAGGATLLLASLTERFDDFDGTLDQSLRVAWELPGRPAIRLRSYSLKRKVYFRMDTERSLGDSAYQWPVNLVRNVGLSRADLGVVGWASLPVGAVSRDVHVPVTITRPNAAGAGRQLQMVLLPSAELSEVFVSVAPVGPNGGPAAYLERDRALQYGFYPADRGVRIALPTVKAPGIYLVEVGATLRGGGSATTRFWMYHAAR